MTSNRRILKQISDAKRLAKEAKEKGDMHTYNYWLHDAKWLQGKLDSSAKNRKKNIKQAKKAGNHGRLK